MAAGDDPALTAIARRLRHSQKITNFVVNKSKIVIMTRFIEISDNAGNRHLVNLSAIASIEDRRKMIVLHFVNTAQKPVSLSMSYGAIKDSIQKGDPITPGGTIL